MVLLLSTHWAKNGKIVHQENCCISAREAIKLHTFGTSGAVLLPLKYLSSNHIISTLFYWVTIEQFLIQFLGKVQFKKSLKKWTFPQKSGVLFEKAPKTGLFTLPGPLFKSGVVLAQIRYPETFEANSPKLNFFWIFSPLCLGRKQQLKALPNLMSGT